MNRTSRHGRPTDTHALEARLAARLAGSLTVSTQAVPHDITERLRVAREQAVQRARLAREAAPGGAQVAGVSASGAALLAGFAVWRQRFAVGLPLVLMVAGLVAIDRFTVREQVLAAADIDAQLLSDTLPPSAYSDPGFAEYLRTVPPQ
jgi:Protein of unknown function (DUF3619)